MTPQLPRDANNVPLLPPASSPAVPAVAVTYDPTISTSTAITLNNLTTCIEVTALLMGIFMKWGGTASLSSFDDFIAPNSTRFYAIPPGQTSVQFIEEAASAHLVVIEK